MYIVSQTFYLDPNSLANSQTAFITGVDLFCKTKPSATNNQSGIANPALHITVSACDILGAPVYAQTYSGSATTIPFSAITADPNANTATSVVFTQPVPLNTGSRYSINIQADDPAYELWDAVSGDALVGTNTPFSGFPGSFQGGLYDYGTDGTLTPVQSAQLKFNLYAAQFTSNSATYEIVNQAFEFFTIANQLGTFQGGENVFPLLPNAAGTISFNANSTQVTGVGTSFQTLLTPNSYIIVPGANTLGYFVRQVASISNNTLLTVTEPMANSGSGANYYSAPVAQVYQAIQSANLLILTDSNANSSLFFSNGTYLTGSVTNGSNNIVNLSSTTTLQVGQPVAANLAGIANNTVIQSVINSSAVAMSTAYTGLNGTANVLFSSYLIGDVTGAAAYVANVFNISVSQIEPELFVNIPPGGNAAIQYDFAQLVGNTYVVNTSMFDTVDNNTTENITQYNALLMSRSYEVQNPTYLYGANAKSGIVTLTVNQSGNPNAIFTSPYIYDEKLDIFSSKYVINNDYSGENTNYGNALAKHLTTVINFDTTYQAEDLMVQAIAYVPAGTQILAFAKIYNSKDSDNFNSKEWTPLVLVGGANTATSTAQQNNYVTLSWGIPNSPIINFTANGTVTATINSNALVGSNTTFGTDIVANSVVKIFSPLFPQNYQVSLVTSVANSTYLTLSDTISNTQIAGAGLTIQSVLDANLAFCNPQNQNIVRYYNSQLAVIDTYDTLQLKMVMISNNTNLAPSIASLTAVGLSS
jgi:hypothetical protein